MASFITKKNQFSVAINLSRITIEMVILGRDELMIERSDGFFLRLAIEAKVRDVF